VMSRDRYASMHLTDGADDLDFWACHARTTFDTKFGDADGLLCPAKNLDRRECLSSASKAISAFADRYVAHVDTRGLSELPTFEDLDMAIDEVGEQLKEVTLLLTAGSLMNAEPVIQADWKRPFRDPIFSLP